jgi:hypothetical protein
MSICNGCGFCCIKAQCLLSVKLFGRCDICPALEWIGSRHICRLAKGHSEELYIGAGCCASLNSWRKDLKDRTQLSK